MRKLSVFLILLARPLWGAGGASSSLTVSSGTFLAIDGFTNNNGNFRQSITIGGSSNTWVADVDISSSIATNVKELSGTAIDTNSGSKSAGTQRMVIATDQPALTNALKVDGSAVTQPVSGTVSSNATQTGDFAVDVSSINHTVVDSNSGNKSAGTLRVILATDQPQLSNKLLVTPDSVALPANQSVNVAQINGVTPLMGNGATGTGSHRVTISNDSSAIAAWGLGATGAAVPSGSHYVGGNGSGNLTGVTVCDNWTAINQTAGAQLFAGVSAKKTYICSINLVSATAQNIALVGGTGTVCATGTHAIAGGTTAATGWNLAANGGIAQGSGLGVIMQAGTAADNVCLLQSASGQVSGTISWTQY